MTHGRYFPGSSWSLPPPRLAALARLLSFHLSEFPDDSRRYPRQPDDPALSEADELASDLARRFWDRLRVFATRRLRDPSAAEDVAQEALRRVLLALRENRVENPDALPGFVFETARHVCLHRLRSAGRESRALRRLAEEPVAAKAPGALSRLIGAERSRQVREALQRLGEEDRAILLMQYEEDLSADEMGSRLGITAAAARVRKHRALRRLGECLGRSAAGNEIPPEGTPT